MDGKTQLHASLGHVLCRAQLAESPLAAGTCATLRSPRTLGSLLLPTCTEARGAAGRAVACVSRGGPWLFHLSTVETGTGLVVLGRAEPEGRKLVRSHQGRGVAGGDYRGHREMLGVMETPCTLILMLVL